MKFTTLFGLWAVAAVIDGTAAKNDKKKKGELLDASFVLIGDSTTNNNTVTPNCKQSVCQYRVAPDAMLS